MNSFCESFCYEDDETSYQNDLMQASTLSTSVPSENCLCGNDPFRERYSPDREMMDVDDIDTTPYDEEQEALTEAFRQMDVKEQHLADQVLQGTINTSRMSINVNEVDEELKLLRQKFIELEQTIKRIETNMGHTMRDDGFEAYKVAREINPEYVKHPLFTTGFLRAEDYHTENAARRIFTYLRIKLELFGRDKLTRDILLDDLGEDGRAYLESGALQILPKRDTSGRRVVFGVGRLNGKGTPSLVLGAVSVHPLGNFFRSYNLV